MRVRNTRLKPLIHGRHCKSQALPVGRRFCTATSTAQPEKKAPPEPSRFSHLFDRWEAKFNDSSKNWHEHKFEDVFRYENSSFTPKENYVLPHENDKAYTLRGTLSPQRPPRPSPQDKKPEAAGQETIPTPPPGFKDDLSIEQRMAEDQDIIEEWRRKKIRENKKIHFENEIQPKYGHVRQRYNYNAPGVAGRKPRYVTPVGEFRERPPWLRWTSNFDTDVHLSYERTVGKMNPSLTDPSTPEGFYSRKPIELMRHLPKEAYSALLMNGTPSLGEHKVNQIPETYYEPNEPTPAFRNQESMFTHDPRDPTRLDEPKSYEDEIFKYERAKERKVKFQQRKDGVAYSPDFDHDLWAEDANRPRHLINDYGFMPHPQKHEERIYRRALSKPQAKTNDTFCPAWDNLVEFRYKAKAIQWMYETQGKDSEFHIMKIKGNSRGCAGVGFGMGKSFIEASEDADRKAAHNMIFVPRYRNRSLSHQVIGRAHGRACVAVARPVRMGAEVKNTAALIKGVCLAFGIQDVYGLFPRRNGNHWTQMNAVWRAFFKVSTPEMTCEDRGQRMVTAFPEVDECSYHLPRGYAHDDRYKARQILDSYIKTHGDQDGFSTYETSKEDKAALPDWLRGKPNDTWTGGLPDISKYKWSPGLVEDLLRLGPGGIPQERNKLIEEELRSKVAPSERHFRWRAGIYKIPALFNPKRKAMKNFL